MVDFNVKHCPVCAAGVQGISWLFECRECGFLFSSLVSKIEDPASQASIDEPKRVEALRELRWRNYRKVLDAIGRHLSGKSILDVGSAHGWFLSCAESHGLIPCGIEPDAAIAQNCGYDVRLGYFPEVLRNDEQFDVISFNDSLEHLPDVNAALEACYRHMPKGGILSVNLPSSDGSLYRIASALRGLGIGGPFDRMWQRQFASPHLSYFKPDILKKIAARHGFVEVERQRLETISHRGLWARLRYDRATTLFGSVVTYAGVAMAGPVIRLLPPDICHQLFRRD